MSHEFLRTIKRLKNLKGTGTELISLYIPPSSNVNEIVNRLRTEYSQASNIKSKQTRKNVLAALDRLIHRLKGMNKAPENGLVLFCGNIDGKIELYEVIPPEPIEIQLYRCDSRFYLEPLEELLKPKEIVGLITIDRREATVAVLKGKRVEILERFTSGVPGKHHKGGQSARRFERLIEIAAHEFFKRVAEYINQQFSSQEIREIIVGGPGPTKEYFINQDLLHNDIKNKIVKTIDTSYTDENGIQELVNKAAEVLKELEISREKEIVNRFMSEAIKGGMVVYGIKDVIECLIEGKIGELLISENLEGKIYACENCGEAYLEPTQCECGGTTTKRNLIEFLEEKCEELGVKIHYISTETTEGQQFLTGFGGLAGFLRYR